jgi:hypothetical protein
MRTRKLTIRRALWLGLVILVTAGLVAPYLHADRFGDRIRRALEQALDRKVEIADVRFNLFRGPGFTLRGVVIHDDPAVGIEPFAYVTSIEARVRFTSLWRGRLEFASLRLEQPSVNLVKSAGGVWNFQPLLNQAVTARPPAITVSGGRLNFKLGGVKSVFYFSNADLEVSPPGAPGGAFELKFSGEPSRTDRTARGFGTLSGRGSWRPGATNGDLRLDADLERSSLGELVALIHGYDIGVHGQVGGHASFRGPLSGLDIAATVQLNEIHRWDLLPPYAAGGPLNFRGKLDLLAQRLDIETVPAAGSAFAVRFRASNYLARPLWSVSLTMDHLPMQPLVDIARHMGTGLPESLTAGGSMLGAVAYSPEDGVHGAVLLQEAVIGIPNAPSLHLQEARLTLDGNRVRLAPAVIAVGPAETARLELDYLIAPQRLDLRFSTNSMSIATFQTESGSLPGLPLPPVFAAFQDGNWGGWLRFREDDAPNPWSGAIRLQGTRVSLPGLAQPLELQRAEIELQGGRIAVRMLEARAGGTELRGEYRFNPKAERPHHLACRIPKLDASELASLLAPTLFRPQSFLSRALRLGRVTVPDWLADRRAEGRIEIDSLAFAGETFEAASLRFFLDGPELDVPRFQARVKGGQAVGYFRASFGGSQPSYVLGGSLEGAAWRGGSLSGEGAIRTSGAGDDLYWNLSAEGSFRAQGVTLGQDLQARALSGAWGLRWDRQHPRLELNDLRLAEGDDVLTGQGLALDTGQLRIDLAQGERRLRLAGSLDPIRLEVTERR